jgi:hypothetical protein
MVKIEQLFRLFTRYLARIVHQIQQGSGWASLDSWRPSGGNVSTGKFGFYLPGGDEIKLSNFSHHSELKLH